ncbi:diacylglycerol kinase family protein [Flagellimonas halotolerans]|uniref:Diacylglycerol kinase family protein n=1 Tax=Flagellimonas halotolerans TaxID=3112164 RepID=A0ABU6IMM7_9FLAO|nr:MULTISPECIES: diacylglycerol kinase family protein [unclassified Allomuricauda]MEC3964489.1 diacylglycerol kinase family protein [Muricauda sp. SYSU M86414]MEC4264358.1 diacylglycerol kinase family protein [Muricauda sp. SYSU M84420]
MPKESFLQNRIKSIGYALKGMFLLLRTEPSIKIQFVITLVVTAFGFYFQISNTEWILQLLAIGLVMGVEGINTAIEKICDYIQPNLDPKIGLIKDISAGAVMIVSVLASIVGLIIYVPKFF